MLSCMLGGYFAILFWAITLINGSDIFSTEALFSIINIILLFHLLLLIVFPFLRCVMASQNVRFVIVCYVYGFRRLIILVRPKNYLFLSSLDFCLWHSLQRNW